MKTLFIHIGHYKTGTTALQSFLFDNREALMAAGVDYVSLGCTVQKHNAYAVPLVFGFYRHDLVLGHKEPAPPDDFWKRLYDYVRESEAPNCLISSEEFICVGERQENVDALRRVVDMAGDDIRFKIIVYLRPPGSHLESWYNQLVKLDRPIGHRSRAIALEYDRVNVDYERALKPWVDIFGAANVMVRAYDARWRNSDALFRDFTNLLPVRLPEDLPVPEKDVNPRMNDRALELVRVLNRIGAPRPAIDRHLERFEAYLGNNPPEAAVTEEQFETEQAAALTGVDWLRRLPHCNIRAEEYRADPPRMRPEWDDFASAVLEYALSELLKLEAERAPTAPAPAAVDGPPGAGA